MDKLCPWAKVLQMSIASVLLFTGLVAGLPATAQTNELPPLGNWTAMRHASFHPTLPSAGKQCLRGVNEFKRLDAAGTTGLADEALAIARENYVPSMCDTLLLKIEFPENYPEAKQCRMGMVPDGIVFYLMNGIFDGRSGLSRLVKKTLGREDKALICPIAPGFTAYWFRDDHGKSCNNVGFHIKIQPQPPQTVTYVDDNKGTPSQVISSVTEQSVPASLDHGCCDNRCDGHTDHSGHSFKLEDGTGLTSSDPTQSRQSNWLK